MLQRYTLVEYEDADSNVKEIYNDVKQTLQSTRLPNWIKAMGTNENILRANWEKTKGTLIKGELPYLLKELIIFVISVKRSSQYCSQFHAHMALRQDKTLTFQDLLNLVEGKEYESMPASYKVAIDVAVDAAMSPNTVTDEDFQKLIDHGFTRGEIQEIFAQADLAVMFNTISSAACLPIEPEYFVEELNY